MIAKEKQLIRCESFAKREVFVILATGRTDNIPVHDHWWS
jgi:hypothetical protein